FTGKAKILKVPHPNTNPEYIVDDDWTIPIGYVSYANDPGHMATFLNVGFWVRGTPADVQAHLFYKGKEIAKFNHAGNGAGSWQPDAYLWGLYNCPFLGVYRSAEEASDGYDPKFAVQNNPGEYEVKVLIVNHLARSIKFTVQPDGSFDNGIATANKLGSRR